MSTKEVIVFTLVALADSATAHAELPRLIDLAVTPPDLSITGAANGNHSGFGLTVGDVNGDGFSDLIVLSYGAEPMGRIDSGEIDIIWGSSFPAEGDLPLSVDSPAFSRIFGTMTQAWYGNVSGGDFNGDGYFDVIWGKPFGPNLDFTSTNGIVYVVFGSGRFPDTLDIETNLSAAITMLGRPYANLGRASCGCDLNGDGYDDIVTAAPGYGYWAEVFILWGGAELSSYYDLSTTPDGITRISDSRQGTYLGQNMKCTDFDADGYDDLVMSSFDGSLGAVTVLFGQPSFPDSISLPSPYKTTPGMLRVLANDDLGASIGIGDADGDGSLDLALANGAADPLGCADCGETRVIFDVSALPRTVWLDGTELTRILGAGSNTFYGTELLFTDLTADGSDELVIVGMGNYNSPEAVDQTFVVYGSPMPRDTISLGSDTTVTRIRGPSHGLDLGRGLTSADFNNDGIPDLALGAHRFNDNTGRTYIFFGCPTPADTGSGMPPPFALRQNFPNPFNPTTTILYTAPGSKRVRLVIYNVGGRRVATLFDGTVGPGEHTAVWNGRDDRGVAVASGVYFCQLSTDDSSTSIKLVLLR